MAVSTGKGKGAHLGRRLLAVEDAPKLEDHNSMCPTWAKSKECVTNSAYMLKNCPMSCAQHATPEFCAQWKEQHRCDDAADFMRDTCAGTCAPVTPPAQAPEVPTPAAEGQAQAEPATAAEPAKPAEGQPVAAAEPAAAAEPVAAAEPAAAAEKTAVATPAAELAAEDPDAFVNPVPYDPTPADLTETEFKALVASKSVVFVNFFAPWCFWSNKLTPTWLEVAERLHKRSYSQSVAFIQVDCTTPKGRFLCQLQSIHAFPSVRIYRGSVRAFEPYEYGRESNVIWLHMVKLTAEIVVSKLQELPVEERKDFTQQIAHISSDLKIVMERREQGLDEDWSEDALSAEEEVKEDRDLLRDIEEAVRSVTGAKGVDHGEVQSVAGSAGMHEDGAEAHLLQERSSDVVLGLLNSAANQDNGDAPGPDAEPWPEHTTHEGCVIFGYLDVSRAPGTLHIAPHSGRHSFDFSSVNTSHHIDHLSFGLELSARDRSYLPESVRAQLTTLDGGHFISDLAHETQEHHINIMPTSFSVRGAGWTNELDTFQFTATSHGRTRDTLPSLIISYDVSPIQAHIAENRKPLSDFVVSLCAIIGGAFSLFGIIDGILFTTNREIRKKLQMGKQY